MEVTNQVDWTIYLSVIIGLGLVALIWWFLPRWQLRRFYREINDPTERADTEDKFRRTIGQILGGAAVLGGLALSIAELQNSRDAIRVQAEAIRVQSDILLKQRLSQQFLKGLELLGANKPAETFGAISALEQVAKLSSDYHWPVINSLTNYVRFVSPKKDGMQNYDKVSPEIQAILTSFARRTTSHDGDGKINLRNTNLKQVELVEANLGGALLDDSILFGANLRNAELSMVSLRQTDLQRANLQGANLRGADLYQTNFSGANLQQANLQKAILKNAFFTGADLANANLQQANLQEAYLPRANFDKANLKGTDLTSTNLMSVTGLLVDQLMKACSNGGTKLPEGFQLKLKPCEGN